MGPGDGQMHRQDQRSTALRAQQSTCQGKPNQQAQVFEHSNWPSHVCSALYNNIFFPSAFNSYLCILCDQLDSLLPHVWKQGSCRPGRAQQEI